jgi:hypothetical protein
MALNLTGIYPSPAQDRTSARVGLAPRGRCVMEFDIWKGIVEQATCTSRFK